MMHTQSMKIAPDALPHGRRATPAGVPGHDVQFYDGEDFLVRSVAKFLAEGIRAGQPYIVIATGPHREQYAKALRRMGFDNDEVFSGREAVWLDARDTLSAFMEGGRPNRELFFATVGNVFEGVMNKRSYLVVRAYGEMVDLLWKDGNAQGTIALEELWNELAAKYSFSLLCTYSMNNFQEEADSEGFRRICAQHVHALPTEEYLEASDSERLRQLAMLQQRSRALDVEISRRVELELKVRELAG